MFALDFPPVSHLVEWPTIFTDPVKLGPHEVFHLAIVAGSVMFYVFIARHVLTHPQAG